MVANDNEEIQGLKSNLTVELFECDKEISVKEELPRLKESIQNEQFKIKGTVLESEDERYQRKKSHIVIYITMFTMSIGFSIVLTGIWPYLKMLDRNASKEVLGWVVAINPLGQMIASPLLGWIGTKMGSHRWTFIFTIAMFVVGNVLYSLLPLFESSAREVMMISRFIVGVSSANMALSRLYISVSTKLKERTTALSITAAVQSLAFILGPVIQTVFAFAFPLESHSFHHFGHDGNTSGNITAAVSKDLSPSLLFNMYSLTGWFGAGLGCINLLIFLPCIYKEFFIAAKEEELNSNDREKDTKTKLKVDYLAVVLCLFSYFSILLMYVLLETLIVPLVLDMYAWEPEYAVKVVGIGLTMAGAFSVIMFIASGRLAKVFGDRLVYISIGLIPLALSMLVFTPIAGGTPTVKHCSSDAQQSLSVQNLTFNVTSAALVEGMHSTNMESDQCEDVGCPSSQAWCFDTPIIHIPQVIAASVLMVFGYPVAFSLCSAMFSKMMRVRDQGLWLGILTSTGSFARFLGPIGVSYIYTVKGPRVLFLLLFTLLISILILNLVFYKRLTPLVPIQKSRSPKNAV